MNTITLKQLKERGACLEQMFLFKQLFGNEVEVTVKRCVKYYNKFDWVWVAACLLSNELWEEYEKIRQSAYEEYEKIRQSAQEEYEKSIQSAWEEYLKKQARAFGECYLKMG